MSWFLYDNGLRHERVQRQFHKVVKHTQTIRRVCLTILWGWRLKG